MSPACRRAAALLTIVIALTGCRSSVRPSRMAQALSIQVEVGRSCSMASCPIAVVLFNAGQHPIAVAPELGGTLYVYLDIAGKPGRTYRLLEDEEIDYFEPAEHVCLDPGKAARLSVDFAENWPVRLTDQSWWLQEGVLTVVAGYVSFPAAVPKGLGCRTLDGEWTSAPTQLPVDAR